MTSTQFPVACIAPPLSSGCLAKYADIIDAHNDQFGAAMQVCLNAIEIWWELPDSEREKLASFSLKHKDEDHVYDIVPLEEEHVKALWEHLPWDYEIDAIQNLFNTIPMAQNELRDAAFHLLWHVKELSLDREPITQDKKK